jgi:hypothetical protein
MISTLTSEQVDQVVSNTAVVLLARPDLLPEWRANLLDLLRQARQSALDEEAVFVAAVLALLHSPGDTLPTGTAYDYAWQSILMSLQTGVLQPVSRAPQAESMTLDRLLQSVTEAVVAVMTQVPEQKDAVASELRQMREAAVDADVAELRAWLDDVLALLRGTPITQLGNGHEGMYATYWTIIARNIGEE